MRTFMAFIRKEWTELVRSGRLVILLLVFMLLGIMNPAVAKLTPRLLEMMADSFAGSGITITPVAVTAMDAWVQFFKNIPLGLIVFILLESSTFTREYQTGTLLLSLTKGLERRKVVLAKAAVPAVLWTVCFGLCFGITHAYSAHFWDNAVVKNLPFSALCWWLFGLWVTALMVFFSTLARTGTGVLAGTGGVVLLSSLSGMLPRISRYLPTKLTDGTSLIYGLENPGAYSVPLLTAAVMALLCFAAAIPVFNRKQL